MLTPIYNLFNTNGTSDIEKIEIRKIDSDLSNRSFKNGGNAVKQVNGGHTSIKFDWKRNKIEWQELDKLNRSQGAVAYLTSDNLANANNRKRQNVKPTGWHYPYKECVQVYNRGHLIAYSLSGGINSNGEYDGSKNGDQNNVKNLFTQTAYSNQVVQTYYEDQVRNALRTGQKVIYKVTPVFRSNELMARGVHLEARTENDMLNFNVFIYNVQPGFKFNYRTGNAVKDNSVIVRFNEEE